MGFWRIPRLISVEFNFEALKAPREGTQHSNFAFSESLQIKYNVNLPKIHTELCETEIGELKNFIEEMEDTNTEKH